MENLAAVNPVMLIVIMLENYMNKYQLISSKIFLFCLFLLLLNDFILKQLFPGLITGKLSDFAGLFVFILFWTWLFPKIKIHIYIFTVLFFIWWKSYFSQTFIDFWNEYIFFQIHRTIDYSDLVALLIIPFAHFYQVKKTKQNVVYNIQHRFLIVLLSCVSIFSFLATTLKRSFQYDQDPKFEYTYKLDSTPEKIITLINENINRNKYSIDHAHSDARIYSIKFASESEYKSFLESTFRLISYEDSTSLVLLNISSFDKVEDGADEKVFLKVFEKDVIEKLKYLLENK